MNGPPLLPLSIQHPMPRRTAIPSALPAVQQLVLSDGDSDDNTDKQHQLEADQDQPSPGPAILISPVKARAAKRGIAGKSNSEVWELSDSEIIGEKSIF